MSPAANLFDAMPRREWQKRCYNLFFLCSVILATAFKDKFNNAGEMHQRLCSYLQYDPSSEKLISCFRGSFKTTYILGFVVWKFIWSLILHKNVALCYNTASKENAEALMIDFQTIVEECEDLHAIFPFIPNKRGQFKRFNKSRVEYKWFKFHVSSLDTRQVSRHYDIIINDDLVNDDNSASDIERERVKRKWRFQQSILTMYAKLKVGLVIEVGTPYHNNDLMSFLMNKCRFYSKFIQPYKNEDGSLALPEVYCQEDFDKILEKQGKTIFSTQYELKTTYDHDKILTENNVIRYNVRPANYIRKFIVDPGGSDPKLNTPTGIIGVDYSSDGKIYQFYEYKDWITSPRLITVLREIRELYDPDDIFVEREKYSITIADTIDHFSLNLDFSFVGTGGMPKEKRNIRAKPFFETRRWLFHESIKMTIEDLGEWPDCVYKELPDCVGYAVDPQVMEFPKRGQGRTDEYNVNVPSDFEAEINAMLASRGSHRGADDAYF